MHEVTVLVIVEKTATKNDMKLLTIENFSCIKTAEIEFARMTLFIGPQASGKSVICKLAYFFIEAAEQQAASLMKLESYEKFTELIKQKFIEWFPIGAWGKEKFKVEFKCGKYSITLTRKAYKKTVSDDFRLKLSDEFKTQYEELLKNAQKDGNQVRGDTLNDTFRLEWKVMEASRTSLSKLMGADYISSQIFIPAGRSFFTSIGKAIAAFEQGRVLDPLIVRFGRLYTAYRSDRIFYSDKPAEAMARKQLTANLTEIFGGQLKNDRENEYVITADGRQIPLSALSSGQQELLPLITVLPHLTGSHSSLCYIEEPEAHLFPLAQSKLVEALVSILTKLGSNTDIVVTTHSPYVLAKINNLIKAGALSRKNSDALRKKLELIIPRRSWLPGRNVKAYAIREGVVGGIKDSDQFIDAEYLDGVSGEISREFSELLDLEASLG